MTHKKSTHEPIPVISENYITSLLSKSKLSFPKPLEKLFREDYYEKSKKNLRIAMILGFILYAVFGVLDEFIATNTKNFIWIIRYIMVCPILLLALLFSYSRIFKLVMQLTILIVSIIIGFGIVAMIAVSTSQVSGLYYAGLILVIMWCCTLTRLRFVYASIATWVIIVGYEVTAIFIQDMLRSSAMTIIFINNNFFFISSGIIGMFSCYLIELYTRKDFLQQLLISEQRKVVMDERNELKIRNDIMDDELQMARKIQLKIIPSSSPSDSISSIFKPMEPIGGDFFDFIKFREQQRLGIFISDVSGHGVPAAFITCMIKSFILESSSHRDDPARMLYQLNAFLINQVDDSFVTAFYAIYNSETRIITYANAGHNPPLVFTGNSIRALDKPSSIPLAIFENEQISKNNKGYVNYEEQMDSPSKILFFTDGLIDTTHKTINTQRFGEVLPELLWKYAERTSTELIHELYKDLVEFKGSEQFNDDVCMICLDVK